MYYFSHTEPCISLCVLTDWLVFDGGAGHAEVQLAVLLDAGVNQGLHGALVLEQQEGVACAEYSTVIQAAQAVLQEQNF